LQQAAGVADLNGAIASDSAAIPKVGVVGRELLETRCDEHLIGRLSLAAIFGFQEPVEPRFERIDALRIDEVLATKPLYLESRLGVVLKILEAAGEKCEK
jgi:hypothetical protein